MSTDIVVFGSRVRDVSVDLNLPSLYRIDRKMRDAIWFEGNDPVLKAQTWLETKIRERTFWFYLEINTQAMDKKARKDLQSYRSGLYKLRGGAKYELTEHGTFNAPRNREGSAPLVIEAPCLGWSWGGGGVNVAVACRALSGADRTPITYIETSRTIDHKEWYRSLLQILAADPTLVRMCADIFGSNPPQRGPKKTPPPFQELANRKIRHWLGPAKMENYRRVARLLAVFDPMESIDLYLTLNKIGFSMFRKGVTARSAVNLVFSEIREFGRSVHDKIIFRAPQESSDSVEKKAVLEHARNCVNTPGLILINTTYNPTVFWAALDWATEIQDRQVQQNNTPDYAFCPILLVLTKANMVHLRHGSGSSLRRNFNDICRNLHNLYIIFNESEAADCLGIRSGFQSFARSTRSGLLPLQDELRGFLSTLAQKLRGKVPHETHFIITMGALGSLGLTQDHVQYVGTYSVPEKEIYSTNGCGDAFTAGAALLIFHKHKRKRDEKEQKQAKPGHLTERGDPKEDLRLMMQLGTATAYAKATSPVNAVRRRDVRALLETAYLPTSDERALGGLDSGEFPQPEAAHSVKLPGILDGVLQE